jgi:hypothetical protein
VFRSSATLPWLVLGIIVVPNCNYFIAQKYSAQTKLLHTIWLLKCVHGIAAFRLPAIQPEPNSLAFRPFNPYPTFIYTHKRVLIIRFKILKSFSTACQQEFMKRGARTCAINHHFAIPYNTDLISITFTFGRVP